MPRGEHARDPEFIKRRLEKRKQTKDLNSKFFFKINDTLRVTRDKYNIILSKKMHSEGSGNTYLMSIGFYSTLESAGSVLEKEGVSKKEAEFFINRIKSIKTKYKDGILITEVPDNFVFDEPDIEQTPEPEEETVKD